MNAEYLLKSLNELDGELVLEAQRPPASRPFYKQARFYAAAAVLLLAAAAIIVKGLLTGGRLRELSADEGKSFTARLTPIAFSSFKGEMRDAGKRISEQMRDHQSYMSSLPTVYSRSFDSCAEAVEYLGYDGLSELPFPFYVSSVSVSASGERSYGFLTPQFSGSQDECEVYGMDICILSQYDILNAETGFIFASEGVRILTDANERHAADSVRVYDSFAVGRDKDDPNSYNIILQSDDERIIEQTFYDYKAQCGEICRIAISHFDAAEPNDSISCYMVHGGMLFDLHLTYYKKDAERALDAMLEWVDSFN